MKPSSILSNQDPDFSFEKMRSEFCIAIGNEFGLELDPTSEATSADYDNGVAGIYDAINAYMNHWLFNVVGEASADFNLEPYELQTDLKMIAQEVQYANGKKISAPGESDVFLNVSIAPNETLEETARRAGEALFGAVKVMMCAREIEVNAMANAEGKVR